MDNTNKTPQSEQILMDTSALNIIKGRLEPHIYAFRIECFPPSYKIGDTIRGVDIRINEWRNIYSGLPLVHKQDWEWSAMIEDSFFRDYAVHKFLEEEKGRKAMAQDDFGTNHYSSEFYLDTDIKEIEEAILYIKTKATMPGMPFKLYSADTLKEVEKGFSRSLNLKLRDNQQKVVDNFLIAYRKGRRNLLMYAVMRFGKTFTALYCAERINAKTILVVSAKADVADEWKKNVQGIIEFEGFKFFDKKNLNDLDFEKEQSEGNTVVLFLTLQDLQGLKIKPKHKKVFDKARIWDVLIVDESHFGARAPQYGLPLHKAEKEDAAEDKIKKGQSVEELDEELKHLKRKVTLHLSGTPYRILMTNEFKDDDLIACVRYPDIVKARDSWYESHIDATNGDNSKVEEWDNPYFGFPQMIRFAFNLNEESLKIIKNLEDEGASIKFSELFSPLSTRKKGNSNSYKIFRHEKEVLSFLHVIDGTKDDKNVLGFLDNERIKQGKLCNHVVMVLPYRASCDSMAAMIENNKDKFKNLCDYKIINIAGLDSKDNVSVIARRITEWESQGGKTLSLTVRKMLTGVTVPEWDTMIYLKESYSPEEYDQATFRLQNQYIKTYRNSDGSIVKYDMKPQTILVDFDPQRMFRLQEQKCSIYNSSPQLRGKQNLKEFITEELAYSPIIFLDHHKLRQIDAADLMDEIRRYAQKRGIPEEAENIPIDSKLLENENILQAISRLNKIDSKNGISKKANAINGKGDDGNPQKADSSEEDFFTLKSDKEKQKEQENIAKKLATYYSLILYFAFLTSDRVTSIEDIINKLDSAENSRIAQHIGLDKNILEIIASSQPWTLFGLNKSINDTNHISLLSDLSQEDMANVVLKRCNRLSESEIVTPAKIADEMVTRLPDDLFEREGIVLDIASKQGEFAVALNKRYRDKYPEECKSRIYSLCTSGLAYEFTRKTYKYLGFNIDNIISDKTSYDIIANKLADKKNGKYLTSKEILGKDVKINAIIGNPPYQEMNIGNGSGSNPLYHLFIDISRNLSIIASLIHPARFLFNAGKTPKQWNKQILDSSDFKVINYWSNSKDVFNNVEINGGLAVTMSVIGNNFGKIGLFSPYQQVHSLVEKIKTHSSVSFAEIVYPRDLYRLTEDLYKENPNFEERQSKGHRLDVGSNIFDVFPELFAEEESIVDDSIGIFGLKNRERNIKWIKRKYIKTPDNIDSFKIIISKADGAAGQIGKPIPAQIIGKPFVADKKIGHTLTFLSIGNFNSYQEASACCKYIKTKFARALVGTLKVTQDNPRSVWTNVPMQIFTEDSDIDWNKSIDEIDAQLYAKYQLSDKEIAFIESMIKPM